MRRSDSVMIRTNGNQTYFSSRYTQHLNFIHHTHVTTLLHSRNTAKTCSKSYLKMSYFMSKLAMSPMEFENARSLSGVIRKAGPENAP